MKTNLVAAAVSVACATAILSIASPVSAQSASGVSRAQVRKECADFMKTHEWSEANGWQLKPGVKAPATSAKTPGEGVAETVAFLSKNRWDDAKSAFVPIKGTPRDVSTMSREQVKKEAGEFERTHIWVEEASTFVPCKP